MMGSKMRVSLSLLFSLPVLPPGELFPAAPCCGSAAISPYAFVVPPERSAVMGMELLKSEDLRYFDASGTSQPITGTSELFTISLGGAFRVAPAWQLSGLLPFRLNRRVREVKESGGGIGDLSLGVRYELYEDRTFYADPSQIPLFSPPLLHIVGKVGIPTGRSPERSRSTLGTDITGSGWITPSLGLEAVKLWGRVGTALLLSAGTLHAPDLRYGGWNYVLSGTLYYLFSLRLLAGASVADNGMRPRTGLGNSTTLLRGVVSWIGAGDEPFPWVTFTLGGSGILGARSNPLSLEGSLLLSWVF